SASHGSPPTLVYAPPPELRPNAGTTSRTGTCRFGRRPLFVRNVRMAVWVVPGASPCVSTVTWTTVEPPGWIVPLVGFSDSHGTSVKAAHWSSSDSFSESGVGLNPAVEPPIL